MIFDFLRNLSYWLDDFLHLKRAQRWSLIQRKLRTVPRKIWGRLSGRQAPDEFDLEEFIDVTHVSDRETRLWKNHLGLLVRHTSKPYDGRITLFRTRDHPLICSFENDLGWGNLAAEVAIRRIPGSHDGIFMEPHVVTLARELDLALNSGGRRDRRETAAASSL